MFEGPTFLLAIACLIVGGMFSLATAYLYLTWRLWREERREDPESGWRLRRRGRDHSDAFVRTEPRAGKRADHSTTDEPQGPAVK